MGVVRVARSVDRRRASFIPETRIDFRARRTRRVSRQRRTGRQTASCRIKVRDAPICGVSVRLVIRKRRFSCRPCGRPLTEPVPGIRSTKRYRCSLLWACENFGDLTGVRRAYGYSSGYVYKSLYAQLELEALRGVTAP